MNRALGTVVLGLLLSQVGSARAEQRPYRLTDEIRQAYADLERMRRPSPRPTDVARRTPPGPKLTAQGVVAEVLDGTLLLAVQVSARQAAHLTRRPPVRRGSQIALNDGDVVGTTLYVRYTLSGDLRTAHPIEHYLNRRVRLTVRRAHGGAPHVIAVQLQGGHFLRSKQ